MDEFIYLGCRLIKDVGLDKYLELVKNEGKRVIGMVLRSSFKSLGLGDINLQKRVFESMIRSVMEYKIRIGGFDTGIT